MYQRRTNASWPVSLTHAQSEMATVAVIGRGSDRAPVNGSHLPVPKCTGKLMFVNWLTCTCKLTYMQIDLHENWPTNKLAYNLTDAQVNPCSCIFFINGLRRHQAHTGYFWVFFNTFMKSRCSWKWNLKIVGSSTFYGSEAYSIIMCNCLSQRIGDFT